MCRSLAAPAAPAASAASAAPQHDGRRRLARLLLGSCLFIAVDGCFFEPALPPEATLLCAGDEDCPPTHRCRSTLGICVDAAAIDDVAPALLGEVVVEPATACAGALVRVSFEVSEALLADPLVRVETPSETLPFSVDEEATDRAAHVFSTTYEVQTDDDEGSFGVLVDLVDKGGSQTKGIRAGVLTVDRTPPSVVGGTVSLELFPASSSLVPMVDALGLGSRARVTFTASEALAEAPSLRAAGVEGLAFSRTTSAGNVHVFELVIEDAAVPQGPHALEAELVDVAGNRATIALAEQIVVDTLPPPALSGATLDALTYKRIPWGATETAGDKQFFIEGDPSFLVEPQATLIFWDDADITQASEVGRVKAGPDGRIQRVTLSRADRARVYVSLVDTAGNVDALEATAVRRVEWVATLAGKVLGDVLSNPLLLTAQSRFDGPPATLFAEEVTTPELVSAADGSPLEVTSLARWRSPTGFVPRPMGELETAYDPETGNVLLHSSGTLSNTQQITAEDQTFLWNGVELASPPLPVGGLVHPQLVSVFSIVQDLRTQRPLLVGTNDDVAALTEVWEWNGSAWRERRATDPEGDGDPPPMYWMSLAYDALRDRTVLFGPDHATTESMTWEWNGRSWTRVAAIDVGGDGEPGVLTATTMVYDAGAGRVLLFGGRDETTGTLVDDLWSFDGESWTALVPTDPEGDGNPSPRMEAGLAYDPLTDEVLLYGGQATLAAGRTETWIWNRASWRKAIVEDPEGDGSPPPASAPRLVADTARGRMLLFHVNTIAQNVPSAWEWTGSSWLALSPRWLDVVKSPSARTAASMAEDRARECLVLFGGAAPSANDETWQWCRSGWRLLAPADPEGDGNPPPRSAALMAWDNRRERVLIFGGLNGTTQLADLWEWNGATWRELVATDPEGDGDPPPLTSTSSAPALVYDTVAERLVLFRGVESGEVWAWDGLSWAASTALDPEGDGQPPRRRFHTAVFDEARGRAVLFGGQGTALLGDTWEWNGTSWEEIVPADPEGDGDPAPRMGHIAFYDRNRARTVVWGGTAGVGRSTDEVWEWDGVSWARRDPDASDSSGVPVSRLNAAAAYSSTLGHAVVFGGIINNVRQADTWEWSDASPPAVGLRLSTAAPGYPVDLLQSMSLRVVTASPAGTVLLVRRDQAWSDEGTTASVANELVWRKPEGRSIARYVHGAAATMDFALVAPPGAATLSVDYAEVRARFLLP